VIIVNIFQKSNLLKLFSLLIFCFFTAGTVLGQSTPRHYLPIETQTLIKSVTITDKTAIIIMSDYTVTVPISVMKNTDYYRATGVTPKGMKIGLKYNPTILRLVVVDATQKNYMVTDFVAKNADKKTLKFPEYYKAPLSKDDIYISSVQFIQSYPLWSADSTSRGFDLLATKEKGIIALFPAIRLELADKLCRASTVTAGIFELLPETQKITCDDLSGFNSQKYLKKLVMLATPERALLTKVLECSQGNRHPKSCQKINQQLAKKTLESVTLETLLKTVTKN
jgi:hypothetical protein